MSKGSDEERQKTLTTSVTPSSQLGAGHIVLSGQVTEQCVLYSALDAHIRCLRVAIPKDAVAHIHNDLADAALRMMERNMGVTITTANRVAF